MSSTEWAVLVGTLVVSSLVLMFMRGDDGDDVDLMLGTRDELVKMARCADTMAAKFSEDTDEYQMLELLGEFIWSLVDDFDEEIQLLSG